jgi:enoyl-CoA hydratase
VGGRDGAVAADREGDGRAAPLIGQRCGRWPAMALVNAKTEAGVALLELNAPPANTYSYEMMRELDAHILASRFEPNVHVILITGASAGGKTEFFCAGADIKMLEGADPYFKYEGAL